MKFAYIFQTPKLPFPFGVPCKGTSVAQLVVRSKHEFFYESKKHEFTHLM